jgi:hypothetical protein
MVSGGVCSTCFFIRGLNILTKFVTRAGTSRRSRSGDSKIGEDVQPIVQITAKLTSSHHLREIPIRCSYQPNVYEAVKKLDAA